MKHESHKYSINIPRQLTAENIKQTTFTCSTVKLIRVKLITALAGRQESLNPS